MKFKLDQIVIYKGKAAVVWDYSQRYERYTLLQDGRRIREVDENELSVSDVE